MRYSNQRGFLPTVLYIVGLLIHLVFIGGTSPYFFEAILSIASGGFSLTTLGNLIEAVFVMVGLVWSIPLIIGSFFVSAFPAIGITNNGIETRTYFFFRSRITWKEIDSVITLPKGYRAIAIRRPGLPLINGLYSNKIYGDIVRSHLPVILLSPQLENIDSLLEQIRLHHE